jgi:hypothetical protein
MTILYCHANRDTEKVSAGHWFFHLGQYANCAQAAPTVHGRWELYIDFEKHGKPLSKNPYEFGSIADAIAFVSDYFEDEVKQVSPDDFPEPDHL